MIFRFRFCGDEKSHAFYLLFKLLKWLKSRDECTLFDKRDLSFGSRTAITSKFKMHWGAGFQTKDSIELRWNLMPGEDETFRGSWKFDDITCTHIFYSKLVICGFIALPGWNSNPMRSKKNGGTDPIKATHHTTAMYIKVRCFLNNTMYFSGFTTQK